MIKIDGQKLVPGVSVQGAGTSEERGYYIVVRYVPWRPWKANARRYGR